MNGLWRFVLSVGAWSIETAGRWVHFAGSCPNDVALGGSPDRFTAVLVWELLDSRQEIERGGQE